MVTINEHFIDTDFRKWPGKSLGHIEDSGNYHHRMRSYRSVFGSIDRSQWGDLARQDKEQNAYLSRNIVEIKDQDGEGSCVGNASTQALQVLSATEFGKDKTTLISAISCYKLIGSSPNSGAMVDDALDALLHKGCVPLDTPANRAKYGDFVMPACGFYSKFPSAGYETKRTKFRAAEALILESVDDVISALFNKHPVVVGRDGHSICYVDAFFKNDRFGDFNSLLVRYVNSWGEWGDAAGDFQFGFGYDSGGTISRASQWAYAITSLIPDYGQVAA